MAVLAALVATEAPPELQAHPTADGERPPEAMPGGQAGPIVIGPEGRSGWALARGLGRDQAGLVLDRVLAVHGSRLSHAMVDVDSGSWLATEELSTARLDPAELERVRAALAEAGLSSASLFPQRIRITKR